MSADTGVDPSGPPPQKSRKRSRSRQSTVEVVRSRSNTTSSKASRPPRSRGSTASIHSCTTQYNPEQQQVPEGYQSYIRPHYATAQPVYHPNPEEMIMRIGDQLANSNSPQLLDPALQENHNLVRPRTDVHFPDHHPHNHNVGPQRLPPGPPSHAIRGEFNPSNYPNVFDGVENQIPDRAVEGNEGTELAPRKKRGTTSSIANDNELRRLLRQYEGYSLHEMAAEVRKHEGAGGKSEKVKQVFAMIWLKENCQKSSGSVRRDRVYCCYAENCGTEHVSVLNPASFGKLVRIIFPNVQTRRLGVRGESKYHYVDLSIIGQDVKSEFEPGERTYKGTKVGSEQPMGDSLRSRSTSFPQQHHQQQQLQHQNQQQQQQNQQQQQAVESVEAVPPSRTFEATEPASCKANCPCIASSNNLSESASDIDIPALKTQLKIQHILRLCSVDDSTSNENDTLRLPNIHDYVPQNFDPSVADALTALYRSHCTSVIDSFRYCKEKNLFRHFSAFQGTLTVPVHKLLAHPDIAPWIEECDWLMYQKMVAFVAPLTTQVVPDPVLKAFRSISRNLVSHIADTFKSQPSHVSLARIMPARLFCHLLKRMLDVNQSANAAAAWLCHAENRNKMWEEFNAYVEPEEMVTKSNIPSCSVKETIVILKEHLKALLYPLENCSASQLELFDQDLGFQKYTFSSSNTDEYTNFPDRWIAFILQLPAMFPRHPAKCMIEKADALWTSILHRLTLAGAQSFSAWWMTKVFFLEMMQWEAEKGGFMHSSPKSLRQSSMNIKDDATGYAQPPAGTGPSIELRNSTSDNPFSNGPAIPSGMDGTRQAQPQELNIDDNDMDVSTARRGSKTMKPNLAASRDSALSQRTLNNDDSAIGLDDESVLLTAHKYADITASDPADAEGDVIVV